MQCATCQAPRDSALPGTDGRGRRSARPLPGTAGAILAALVHPPFPPAASRDRIEPFRSERARSVGWAIAACVAARTSTLRRLGPFDPSQFLFYEDMDLALLARRRRDLVEAALAGRPHARERLRALR